MARWRQIGLKRCLYALVAVALACVVFLIWALLTASDTVSRGNYNKIHVGMTEAQVEALLGVPGEELAPLTYEDVHADEQPGLLLRSFPHRLRHWRSGTHMITVVLDSEGRVVGKSYSRDSGVGLPRRIIDWLGL